MERKIEKEVKRTGNEKLIWLIEKGGTRGLEAAEEMYLRGEFGAGGENLRKILDIRSVPRDRTEEATKVKNEAAKVIIERDFLNKRNLLTILRQIKSQKILNRAIRKYLAENKNVPNFLLEEMIHSIKFLSLKETLAEKVLDQKPKTDDLLVIVEELEDLERFPKGSPLQTKAWKRLWQRWMSIENFKWIIGFVLSLAEQTWTRGKKKEKGKKSIIEKLSTEDVYEISRYTDSLKVKRETLNQMWFKRKDLTEKQLEYVKDNADLITIEDPEKAREWIHNKILSLPLKLEEAMSLKKEIKSSSLKLKMAEKALGLVEEEIEEKEKEKQEFPYRYLTNGWRENQLNELKEKKEELKGEILNIQEQIQESVEGKAKEIEISIAPQT